MKGLKYLGVVAMTAVAAGANAQQGGCRPATDEEAILLAAYVEALASDSMLAEDRARMGLTAVPVSQVEIVTGPVTCATAAQEFGNAVGSTYERQVYLVRMGSWYVVEDPEHMVGEYVAYLIFTSDWNLVAALAG